MLVLLLLLELVVVNMDMINGLLLLLLLLAVVDVLFFLVDLFLDWFDAVFVVVVWLPSNPNEVLLLFLLLLLVAVELGVLGRNEEDGIAMVCGVLLLLVEGRFILILDGIGLLLLLLLLL